MPEEEDLRAVHLMLEQSFADHFNSYRETFDEFVNRLREDPGHRWDHWWLATVDGEPAGALVATTVTGRVDDLGVATPDSSYVEYIGVHRRARGRGVAKALLRTVMALGGIGAGISLITVLSNVVTMPDFTEVVSSLLPPSSRTHLTATLC